MLKMKRSFLPRMERLAFIRRPRYRLCNQAGRGQFMQYTPTARQQLGRVTCMKISSNRFIGKGTQNVKKSPIIGSIASLHCESICWFSVIRSKGFTRYNINIGSFTIFLIYYYQRLLLNSRFKIVDSVTKTLVLYTMGISSRKTRHFIILTF